MKIYKLRHKSTGLYYGPRTTLVKVGKLFTKKSFPTGTLYFTVVNDHVERFNLGSIKKPYSYQQIKLSIEDEFELEEYELVKTN